MLESLIGKRLAQAKLRTAVLDGEHGHARIHHDLLGFAAQKHRRGPAAAAGTHDNEIA